MADTTIMTTCENCGKEFFVKPSTLASGRGKDCSLKCSYESRARNSRKRIIKICQRCGKEFEVTPSVNAKGKGNYCSNSCKNPPVIKICGNCGKEFRSSPSAYAQFCSKSCSYKSDKRNEKISQIMSASWGSQEGRNIHMTGIRERSNSTEWKSSPHFQRGENNPKYKGNRNERNIANGRYEYKQWHKQVLQKDNFTCQKCGKRGGKLEAHHIKEWAIYPELRYDVSNGNAVCVSCHKDIHK